MLQFWRFADFIFFHVSVESELRPVLVTNHAWVVPHSAPADKRNRRKSKAMSDDGAKRKSHRPEVIWRILMQIKMIDVHRSLWIGSPLYGLKCRIRRDKDCIFIIAPTVHADSVLMALPYHARIHISEINSRR